jgi:hypothetical protein
MMVYPLVSPASMVERMLVGRKISSLSEYGYIGVSHMYLVFPLTDQYPQTLSFTRVSQRD